MSAALEAATPPGGLRLYGHPLPVEITLVSVGAVLVSVFRRNVSSRLTRQVALSTLGRMTDKRVSKPGPIEVWLRQGSLEVTCIIVYQDETTELMGIQSLSLLGAQREVTGWLVDGSPSGRRKYTPVGRWDVTYQDHGEPLESMRRFRPASDVTRF